MNSTSLSSKSAACRRQLLLDSVDSVNQRDIDTTAMDTSISHRSFMRDQLYGANRVAKIVKAKPLDHHEPGENIMGFPDEIPPKWISTSKAEYTPKILVSEREKIKEVANYLKKAHFTLDRGSEPSYTSITKKDYNMDPNYPIQRPGHNVISYSQYPPIYRDETLESLESRVNQESNTQKMSQKNIEPRLTRDSLKTKNKTNISLGNESIPWISVTKSSMRQFDHIQEEESYIKESKNVRSTVLDYPDMEKVPMTSVHQQDYSKNSNVDHKSLIVDSTSFIKDLKATHFSLGDPEMTFGTSQYDSSFKRHESGLKTKELPPAAFPAQGQCVIVEDLPDRKIGTSSHKVDFGDITETVKNSNPSAAGKEVKGVNGAASISFGTNNTGLSKNTVSVTSKDYRAPNEIDSSKAQEAYSRRGETRKPDIPFFDPINMDSEVKCDYSSVAKMEFTLKVQDHDAKSQSRENKMYLRTHHFSFGEPEQSDRIQTMITLTHSHFKDPSKSSADHSHTMAAGSNGPCSKVASSACNSYETTMANTISRYPYDKTSFQTVTSNVYKPLIGAERALPFKPRADLLGDYLHPQVTHNGPIRELTTVTRRSYVPPEVMKFH